MLIIIILTMKVIKKTLPIVFIFILSITTSCTVDIKIKKLNEIAQIKQCYIFKTKEVLLVDPADIKSNNDSLVFITDSFYRKVYKYNKNNQTLVSISSIGDGPGEFISPFSIAIKENSIVVNDWNTNNIQEINTNGSMLRKINVNRAVHGNRLCFSDSGNLIMLNSGTYNSFYFTDEKNNQFAKIPVCFTYLGFASTPISYFLEKDIVYYMNPFEMVINTFDLKTMQEDRIEIKNITKIFNWSKYYDEKIPVDRAREIVTKEVKIYPIMLLKMIVNGEMYFLVAAKNMFIDNKKAIFYIINKEGKSVLAFSVDEMIPYDYIKGKLCCFKRNISGEIDAFYELEFTSEILNNISAKQ